MSETEKPQQPPMQLYIAVPCFGGVTYVQCWSAIMRLTHLLASKGIGYAVDTVLNESLVQRARNMLVDNFLKSSATHLLFIDADIQFREQDVLALLETGHPVVCGAYPKKGIEWEGVRQAAIRGEADLSLHAANYAINLMPPKPGEGKIGPDGSLEMTMQAVNGCVPILDAATGFLLIQRQVIERMIAEFPEMQYTSDAPQNRGAPMFAVFDCGIRDGRYLSEDYFFSRRWQSMGGTVWMHLGVKLGHVGSHVFKGDIGSTFKVLSPPKPVGAPRMETPTIPPPAKVPMAPAARPSVKPHLEFLDFEFPPGLDMVARKDLEEVLAGSYDVPVDNVETVLDVGANIGSFSRWAQKRWPAARIEAYEPHPSAYGLLCQNVPGIKAHKAALGEASGQGRLREGVNWGCSSFHDLGLQRPESVYVSVADAALIRGADIVKVDTEGDELAILNRLDTTQTKAVMYEWHRANDHLELATLMRRRGFRLHSEEQLDPNRGVAKWLRKEAA